MVERQELLPYQTVIWIRMARNARSSNPRGTPSIMALHDVLLWQPRSASISDRHSQLPTSRTEPDRLPAVIWQETTAETPSASQGGRRSQLQLRYRGCHPQATQLPRRIRGEG